MGHLTWHLETTDLQYIYKQTRYRIYTQLKSLKKLYNHEIYTLFKRLYFENVPKNSKEVMYSVRN